MNSITRKVVFVEYISLPEQAKKMVRECEYFHKNVCIDLQHMCGLSVSDVNKAHIEAFYEESKGDACYDTTSFEAFLKDVGYEWVYFLSCQNLDLTGVDDILVDISW